MYIKNKSVKKEISEFVIFIRAYIKKAIAIACIFYGYVILICNIDSYY